MATTNILGFNFKLNDHYSIHNNAYCYTLYDNVNQSNILFINDLNMCLDKSIKWLKQHNQHIDKETLQQIEQLKQFNNKNTSHYTSMINNFIGRLN